MRFEAARSWLCGASSIRQSGFGFGQGRICKLARGAPLRRKHGSPDPVGTGSVPPLQTARVPYNDADSKMFAKRTNWNLTPNRLSEALAAHRAAGKPLLDLTVSNPTECGFEYDSGAILDALRNPAALSYEPNPRGLESARRAVAGYYAGRCEAVPADHIFLTTSTSEAYSYVFRTLCNPG